VRRGEVWLVELDPARDGEANKFRPCVIVSNDGSNAAVRRTGRGVVTVVPMTSNTARVWPFQVLIEARLSPLALDSKVQAEQVRAVAADRFARGIGALNAPLMARVDEALRVHLSLS